MLIEPNLKLCLHILEHRLTARDLARVVSGSQEGSEKSHVLFLC